MIHELYNYYHNNMKEEQFEDAQTLFNDNNRLISFLIYSYNCYETLHSKGNLSLITNPNALFKTPESEQQFVIEFKNYIRDVLANKKEDIQYANSTNNRAKQETIKNR